jgi:hypothetical protein
MKIRHLLSMSTGHALDTTGRIASRKDGDWVKGFLSLGVKHRPGTHFVYNSGATYMLSAIIQKVTGMPLIEYLRPRLFEPLGIANPTWESCPRGINTGGWGLSIRTEDIARFGQMYLQKGLWNGQRILPEEWVAQASAFQVQNSHPTNPDWRQGYGFQFWRCQHGAYRGDGAFGQFCVVMPEQDAVLAITSGVANMQAVLDLVWKHLLPALQSQALPPAPAAQKALEAKLTQLMLPPPAGAETSPMSPAISGKTFHFQANPMRLESLSFDFSTRRELTIRLGRGRHLIVCGFNDWVENQTTLFAQPRRANARPSSVSTESQPVCASAVWTAEDTLQVTLRRVETPFYNTLACRFADDRVEVTTTTNVGFGPEKAVTFTGIASCHKQSRGFCPS